TWMEAYSPFIPEGDLQSYHQATYNLEALKTMFADRDVKGFVAEFDGALVGCIRTKLERTAQRFYVSSLYVLPHHQGKGIGRTLMTMAAREAVALGHDRIWIGVMERNKDGLDWYQKFGYRVVEEAPFTMGKSTVNHFIGFVPVKPFSPGAVPTHKEPTRDPDKRTHIPSQRVFSKYPGSGGIVSLPQRVDELLQDQKNTWQQFAEGTEALKATKTRQVECNGNLITLQFNPKRIVSTGARLDEATLKARKCFLCVHNLPEEQRGILYHDNFLILCNPAPIFEKHLTIAHIDHCKQAIEPFAGTMLELARDLGPSFTLFYNGPKCGASAPDHAHFQACPSNVLSIEQLVSREATKGLRMREKEISVWSLGNCGRTIILVRSTSRTEVEKSLRGLLAAMRTVGGSPEEPMVNILCTFENQSWEMIIFPRRKHRPDVYFKEGSERILISPAAVDLAGFVVTPVEKDFVSVEARLVEQIYSEVCLDSSSIDRIFAAFQN
ncbi:MAG TPA: GNAT family N-acetyltransferase, partial [Bacteroidota bacterium]